MATDIAVSAEPVHRLNLVWEGRFMSDPRTASVWDDAYSSGSSVRSAYVLIDDLPYNTFAMYGIYRPMFGHYNPDHTTLFARATGLTEHTTFKAASVGTAPNVPFLNVHEIEPFANRTQPQDRGFAANAGGRFVTLGAYFMLSWWETKAKDFTTNVKTHRQMQSLTGGLTKGRLTVVADITKINLNVETVRQDTGTVITLEPRYRVWNESYLKGGWEYLNTASDLRLGRAKQFSIGISSFLVSGLELEVMYKELKTTELGVDSLERNLWGQMHFFF